MAEIRYKGRIAVMAAVVVLGFAGIAVRLCIVQLKPAAWIIDPIKEGRFLESKMMGNRGLIVDCNNEILAMDLPAYHVALDPKYIHQNGDPELVVQCLSAEFGIPEEQIRMELVDTNRQWVAVQRHVPAQRLSRFERRAFGTAYTPKAPLEDGSTNVFLRGVMLEETSIRNYPKKSLMAHVVGFSNLEGEGSAGIEQSMNDYLHGKEGRLRSKKDGRRDEMYSKREIYEPAENGATVMLTLDQQLQYVVEGVVERTCRDHNAQAAWAVVQRVGTGEILAMASFPTYDLNRYRETPEEWMRNRAISVNYEPGSVMKAAVISRALDDGVVKAGDLIDCEKGYWAYGGSKLEDSHPHEEITVADVVKFSSNIGTAKIAMMMGEQSLYNSLKSFHFADGLKVGLPGEEAGILYSPRNWSKISITRIGMGHEIAVTALQMLSMMSAIANNGIQLRPYVVKKVIAPDGEVLVETQPEVIGRPIKPRTALLMRTLLARVTEEGGTGTKARVDGYTVAGKTGTAQKVRPREEGGGYYPNRFWSSFAGFLPAQNPKISIIVVVDDPVTLTSSGAERGEHGGTVCGPAFKEIAEFAVGYLRIASGEDRYYIVREE